MTQAVSICWANKWLKPSKALFLVCLATSFSPDADLRPQRPSNTRVAARAARAGRPKHETALISQLQGIELADFTTPMKQEKAA